MCSLKTNHAKPIPFFLRKEKNDPSVREMLEVV